MALSLMFECFRPTLRKLEPHSMYEIWVRDISSIKTCIYNQSSENIEHPCLIFLSVDPQEDDIDGEHIVAFAEEDDPGTFIP